MALPNRRHMKKNPSSDRRLGTAFLGDEGRDDDELAMRVAGQRTVREIVSKKTLKESLLEEKSFEGHFYNSEFPVS